MRSALPLLLLLPLLPGCDADTRPVVAVRVTRLSSRVRSLAVGLSLPDRPAPPPRSVTYNLDSFLLQLPAGTHGRIAVLVDGLDAAGCKLQEGDTALEVGGPPRYQATVDLRTLAEEERGCRLVVQRTGDGVVTSTPPGILCSAAEDRCAASFPLGTPITLEAQPAGSTYFAGWSSACEGLRGCALTVPSGTAEVGAVFLDRTVCRSGWCWENPLPHGNPLLALWGPAEDDVWAAGGAGWVQRYNGVAWVPVETGVDRTLHGLWGFVPPGARPAPAADRLYAVGEHGTLLRWEGAAWRPLPSGTQQDLFAVWGAGPNDVWAAGAAGTILHGDGATFTRVASGTAADLLALWGAGPSDVWAAGAAGTVLRYDGARWQKVDSGTGRDLTALLGWSGTGDPGPFAAGRGGLVLRWRGAAFAPVPGAAEDLLALWGTGPGDLWLGGAGGALYRFDGTALRRSESGVPADLRALLGQGTAAWAGGASGTLLRWNGSFWARQGGGPQQDLLGIFPNQVLGPESPSLIALTAAGHMLLQIDPSSWIQSGLPPGPRLRGSSCCLGGPWLVGERGAVFHYDADYNGRWRLLPSGTTEDLWGVWQLRGDAWVVGGHGTILHLQGDAFVQANQGAEGIDGTLFRVWGRGPDDVWAVGEAGTILRFDGSTWARVASPTRATLRDINGQGANLWAVGDGGTVLVSSGAAFTALPSGTAASLRAVQPLPGEAWIVGEMGTVLHHDGHRLKVGPAGVASTLTAVYAGRGEVWVAGEGGAILHLRQAAP